MVLAGWRLEVTGPPPPCGVVWSVGDGGLIIIYYHIDYHGLPWIIMNHHADRPASPLWIMLQLPAGLGVEKSLKRYVYNENGAFGSHKLPKRYVYNENGAFGGQKSPKHYVYNENGAFGGSKITKTLRI